MAAHGHDYLDLGKGQKGFENNRVAPKIGGLYDRFVNVMRVALPAVALAIALLVVAWPALNPSEFSFLLAVDQVQLSPERLRMVKPEYFGTDSKNRPFTIQAESALQEYEEAEKVTLKTIEAQLKFETDVEAVANAEEGVYYPASKALGLVGDVMVKTTNDYVLEAEDASIDLEKRLVSSEMPVLGTGPHGRFEAQGFVADIAQEVLTFKGGVRSVLDPKKAYNASNSSIKEKAQP